MRSSNVDESLHFGGTYQNTREPQCLLPVLAEARMALTTCQCWLSIERSLSRTLPVMAQFPIKVFPSKVKHRATTRASRPAWGRSPSDRCYIRALTQGLSASCLRLHQNSTSTMKCMASVVEPKIKSCRGR
ncbi:hypothetical protein CSPX01_09009 [Colletotrichum filicis]|nr:hypothetical protein CSPX01_09009 [Colletotrichum filicis]